VGGKAVETFEAKYLAQKFLYTVSLFGSIPPFLTVLYVMQYVNGAGRRVVETVSLASSKAASSHGDLHEVSFFFDSHTPHTRSLSTLNFAVSCASLNQNNLINLQSTNHTGEAHVGGC
jgi:hypothetical protein